MKRLFSILLSLAVIALSMVSAVTVLADDETTINRYNVVFVIDASTSMKYSDPDNNRFEATDLFLGMLADDGNYVGSVLFNGNVTSEDIVEVNGNSTKKSVSEALRNSTLGADTNIGGALLKATELLESNANESLPSIIILLSDGNTDFDDEKQIQQSKEQKETALETARDKGYTIYAVSLNSDGTADTQELKRIAAATEGGVFEEVSDAADLKEIFDKFYTKIYGTKSSKLVDEKIGSDAKITKNFTVSDVGVEEVNIAVFGEVGSCSLTNPDGEKLSASEMEDITFAADTFKIIKLINPQAGKWTLTATGKAGTKITVVKTYNVNLNIKTTVENEAESYKANSPIHITAKLFENNEEITDMSQYAGFKAIIKVTDYDGNIKYEDEVGQAGENGFEFSFTPEELNTYYADISVEGTEVYAEAEQLVFNIGNTAPQAVEDTIKKHINIWPFLIKTNATVDLSQAAEDNEDETLNFKVVSSTWNEDDYTLDGSSLTIDSFKNVSKGSFEVQAADTQGAYCTFNVKVTSTNIGVLAMILIIAAALIAVTAILLIANYKKMLPFIGEVIVKSTKDYKKDTIQKGRGQIKLSSFNVNFGGIDPKSYFQATGKNYIYFISKKPVFTDLKKVKKVKIDSNFDVQIYSDEERTKGIEVNFNSFKNNLLF